MNSGIYIIENLIDGKIYIGPAVNVERRLYFHRWSLQKGKHDNIHLQRAWNKYGDSVFLFKKCLSCANINLIFFEQLVIDATISRCGRKGIYNINLVAGSTLGRKCPDEVRMKISITSKKGWKASY